MDEDKIKRMEIFFLRVPYAALEASEKSNSGSFVRSLCETLQRADHENYFKLVRAFPAYFLELYDFWQEYIQTDEARRELQ